MTVLLQAERVTKRFPAAGFGRDFYYCSFAALTRVCAAPLRLASRGARHMTT